MLLSEILLEEIKDEEFSDMYSFWYPFGDNVNSTIYAKLRILDPLIYPNYDSLLSDFLDNQFCDSVSFCDKGKWKKCYSDELENEKISAISLIAENDRYKRGHFKLFFKCNPDNPKSKNNVSINFVEIGGLVYSYDINFPVNLVSLFSWDCELNFGRWKYKGLWVPSDVEYF
ncbi:MAG: hypothetical protein ABIH25_03700 [Candidatus Woesearchaeota archaeon]